MIDLFLHGGGDHPDWRAATFGRFLAACTERSGPLALIIAEADQSSAAQAIFEYGAIFTALGWPSERMQLLAAFADQPLTAAQLPDALAGVYVCGGLTPRYHQALCRDQSWLEVVRAQQVPYGGTSAGAMIAATQAILGGWKIARSERMRQFVFPGAGEGLDDLTVQPGLGLTPFAIDVHAGQMGTLSRLINAVAGGIVAEGWALDEDTQLEIRNGRTQVVGRGMAYHVSAADAAVQVQVVPAG